MIIFNILVYMLIAWLSMHFIYFVVNKTWHKNYTPSEADKKCAAICGIVWPVALPVVALLAVSAHVINFLAKGLK